MSLQESRMQKARIITQVPESARHVAEQLESRGYAVEIIAPGESVGSRADLEIVLEVCARDEVLNRVAEMAETNSADVYIGAGCFGDDEAAERPARVVQPSIADTVNGVAAGLQNKRDLLAKALREQRLLMRQARAAEGKRREQEAVLRAAEQAERERLAREAEALRKAEDRETILRQEHEAERLRVARPETTERDTVVEEISGKGCDQAEVHLSIARKANATAVRGRNAQFERRREWRKAVLVSGILALMLMLGWSAVARRPLSPMPKPAVYGANSGVESQVPYGTTRVNLAAGSSSQSTGTAQKASALPEPHDTDRAHTSNQAKPSGQTRLPKASRISAGDDEIAEDEVRDLRRPSAAVVRPVPPQNASLRRYSDMQ